jgi:hypothetical protein
VVVIPIYWAKRPAERAVVVAAAEALAAELEAAGVAAHLDADDATLPGSKFKRWEEAGVGLRVELGPKDVAAGRAVLAVAAGVPGEVAAKAPHPLGGVVGAACRVLGLARPAPPPAAAEEAARAAPPATATPSTAPAAAEDAAGDFGDGVLAAVEDDRDDGKRRRRKLKAQGAGEGGRGPVAPKGAGPAAARPRKEVVF